MLWAPGQAGADGQTSGSLVWGIWGLRVWWGASTHRLSKLVVPLRSGNSWMSVAPFRELGAEHQRPESEVGIQGPPDLPPVTLDLLAPGEADAQEARSAPSSLAQVRPVGPAPFQSSGLRASGEVLAAEAAPWSWAAGLPEGHCWDPPHRAPQPRGHTARMGQEPSRARAAQPRGALGLRPSKRAWGPAPASRVRLGARVKVQPVPHRLGAVPGCHVRSVPREAL